MLAREKKGCQVKADQGNGRGRPPHPRVRTTPPQGEDKPSPLLWTGLARRFVSRSCEWGVNPYRATTPPQGEDKPSPIRTNLRIVEFECEFSKHLPRPWRSLRLEENRLLTLALLPVPCCRETLLGRCAGLFPLKRERTILVSTFGAQHSPHPSTAVLLSPGEGHWLLTAPPAFPYRCP